MGFVANFVRFPAVQKFRKSVKILQSYSEFKVGNFFETQCIILQRRQIVTDSKFGCRTETKRHSALFENSLNRVNSRTDNGRTASVKLCKSSSPSATMRRLKCCRRSRPAITVKVSK